MLVVQRTRSFTLVEMFGREDAVALRYLLNGDRNTEGAEHLSFGWESFGRSFQGTWEAPNVPVRMARSW